MARTDTPALWSCRWSPSCASQFLCGLWPCDSPACCCLLNAPAFQGGGWLEAGRSRPGLCPSGRWQSVGGTASWAGGGRGSMAHCHLEPSSIRLSSELPSRSPRLQTGLGLEGTTLSFVVQDQHPTAHGTSWRCSQTLLSTGCQHRAFNPAVPWRAPPPRACRLSWKSGFRPTRSINKAGGSSGRPSSPGGGTRACPPRPLR